MKLDKETIFRSSKLYPILDLDYCKNQNLPIESLIELWQKFPKFITVFQLRGKSISLNEYAEIYFKIISKFPEVRIIINDHWKFAIEVGAFGIHIGKEDFLSLSKDELIRFREASTILKGTSSHSIEDLESLDFELWNYTGFGPIFHTTSKETKNKLLGIETLKEATQKSKITLVPIGGISVENFEEVWNLGSNIPASINMIANEKSILKIVDFIRNHPTMLESPILNERPKRNNT